MWSASQICVIALMAVAGIVSFRQYKKDKKPDSMTWFLIFLYWVILTLKNACDYFKI